ncbi:SDR family NAD(P)-dependent oxidoreductase [Leptospira langatensis]|uniref:SDR family NAD(P)-dependent oxidoreductase n=1 Tax=Leptospira langatensis TaxID=2484983 RepID=A0A5F1ZSY0_9LEPT|nr:SDR family NAD(P)-dependent oxidoreductase [Leptospira langatensis]TGK02600.1 SDR family NAD(P)-dependent oxidoreductase [Leptospira langatensis]TGL40199.1 SDR family NAD(P)-dependent oxidoreductase [Leptospira langatensis]
MKSFKNKVAAITGAGSGMGRELAIQLAERGCDLALSDVNESGLAETIQIIKSQNKNHVTITSQKLDVSDRSAVFQWAAQVAKDHNRVNMIFNNAGIAFGSTIEGFDEKDFKRVMDINFWGVVHGTQAFLPFLKASGEGHVINTSSVFGIIAVPGTSAYNSSKFAVRGFTETLRQELDVMKCGVSATSVHPGGIQTAIAKSSQTNESVRSLGLDPNTAKEKMSAQFITTPKKAASVILKGVRKNSRRVLIGPDATFVDLMQRIFPSFYQLVISSVLLRQMK